MTSHIAWDPEEKTLIALDQRVLPQKEEFVRCQTWLDAANAIKNMTVRGAPLIGVTAAFGCVLALKDLLDDKAWMQKLQDRLSQLQNSRPTAVNLAWAIERMRKRLKENPSPRELYRIWEREALRIMEEDETICKKIGQIGQIVIPDGATVLTHCNAGALATAGYGTALGVIRAAVEAGKKIKVIADETRPFLQGARLTAWELAKDGIDVTIACDNACAWLMRNGLVQLAITGADRIAANGDTANKIGTLGVAILASHFKIPFYVAAPLSTIDPKLQTGSQIPIEQRPSGEVTTIGDSRIAPAGIPAFNYAFDVTPATLICGIITENGILRPPYEEAIKKIFPEN